MRTSISFAAALLTVALSLYTPTLQAQIVHFGESFDLNDTLHPSKSHEYYANSHISLNPGFHSEPKNHKHTLLQLDPYGIYPPESGLTGGPNPADTGVVGTIGGTVDVGLMGAAVYSIPIEVPQGINGMQPSLSITYNSQAGNGLLGWGWDITGLSSIERTGMTRYHDGVAGAVTINDVTDRFLLDGVRLIAVADYTDSVEYKTEQDGMSKIMGYFRTEYVGGGMFGYGTIKILERFKIWKSDGLILEYGCSLDSKLMSQTNGEQVLCWLLKIESDRNGNSVTYHYDTHHDSGEYYISSIDYTKHSENGQTIVEPEFSVVFHYRPGYKKDYDFQYIEENIVQSRKLIDHVSVIRSGLDTEMERYSFKYTMDSIGVLYGYERMHSRLMEIRLEKEGTALNPTRIIWTSTTNYDNNVLVSERIYDSVIYNNFPFVGDFNGDGYSDLAVVPFMDSVYAHNVDVEFFLNNSTNPGHFIASPTMALTNVDKNLDWIYPVDLNDDGLDDLIACFYDSLTDSHRDTMSIRIFENEGGTHFHFRDSITLGGGRFLVRAGDFLGNGKIQLLLMPVISNNLFPTLAFLMLVYYDGNNLVKKMPTDVFWDVCDIATGDFNGDCRTDVMVIKESGSIVYSLVLSGSTLSCQEQFGIIDINHANGRWNHVFTGDFNGDGMTDLLYNDTIRNNNNIVQSRWRIFYSQGHSFSATESITSLGVYKMPESNLYSNSLRKVIDVMNLPNNKSHLYYSACVSDFDGDGTSDIAVIRMTSYSSDIDIYFHYLPSRNSFQSFFDGSGYNGSHNNDPNYCYINCRTQYFHLGNYLGRENICFLGLEYRESDWIVERRRPAIFSLKPASALNSVSVVIDGKDNPVGFGYGYVQQPYLDFNHGVRRMPVPVRVLTTITTYNATDNQMRELLVFTDPCYHRDGHGWLGFKKQTRRSFEDGTETSRTVSIRSLGAMTTHAMLLPEADTVYVFPHGTKVLSSVTTYGFEKVCSNLAQKRLVTCPALIRKNVVKYDPDNPNTVLSKSFVENHFNYSDGLYDETYHCDSTRTGVDDATGIDFSRCEYRTVETNTYYPDNYGTWTINRPHCQKQVQSKRGKPDVEKSLWYNYVSGNSYAVSRVCELPSVGFIQSPFLVQTDFEYYPDGNLKKKTVKVPYGQRDEQQKNYEYEYGPGDQQRLVTKETVSSGGLSYATSYAYDQYDRIDTLTGANGLATTFDNDALGITSWTQNADGTRTCIVQRWASGHPLKPQGALYYTWERSSDGKQNLVFYHKTGTELRSVAYGIHGEPIITDKRYDHRGRLSAVSNPYKESEKPRWTIYGYDNLDRLTTLSTPDTTVTSIVHDGFRTETTVTTPQGLAQESAAVVNAMGWTVRSEDASGSYLVFDHYADGLVATVTIDENPSTTVTAVYDDARHRTSLTDPDYGILATRYDAYGRLTSSTTPRESAGQTQTEYVYDGFDRVVLVADGLDGTVARYSYNESGVAKGTLEEVLFREAEGANIQDIKYGYDNLARPISLTEQRANGTYTTTMEYNGQSQVSRQVYPSGFAVRYDYRRGRLRKITDDENHLLWKTNDIDASGQLLEAELGNGAVTRYAYDTVMRRLESIVTTNNLQNLSYSYDKFGNLAARKDNIRNLEETFEYDSQNRLTEIRLRPTLTGASVYDSYGRMTTKIADGIPVFFDATFSVAKPHAMDGATTSSGVFPDDPQTITYTGFDKVSKIKLGNDSLCYTYGYDRQRVFMEEHVGNRHRTKRYVGNCEYVTESEGGSDSEHWLTYLSGPMGVYAVVLTKSGSSQVFYILKDNLGSWTTITDEHGNVEQRLSYDPWGNLRDPDTWANYTPNDVFNKPMFDRGYTGHEHLSAFGLINMNGRMYDPVMSSFLSVDRFVQNPMSAQGFNRYAYCMYNPLRYVDPTGWLSGGGGGHSNPLPKVIIDGYASYVLPEITILPDNPSLANYNTYEEFWYTPNMTGGGRNSQWSNADKNTSIGPKGGARGGNHGGGHTITNQDLLNNLAPVISIEGIVIGYKQQQWQNPKTKTQKAINQKKAYEIQKALKNKGISKHVKDIKAGKAANLGRASKGVAALGIGLEVYDVINNEKIMPSNILNTTITTISVWCWPIGGIYLITDIGVLSITGQSIGEHLDEWICEPVIDFNKP
ncbi:MAG: VCBS repeat-containing protein [Bacteroidales bacterium]|nr:VCBS repeat-containing protein [Bacteroidales bacterium]MBQ6100766.1 VCBS repeat-containing protein [Bacteroidales bacterium]